MSDERQELLDRFYFAHGACCAGCDWWRSMNSKVGQCTKSKPTAGAERWAMLGIESISMAMPAGHLVTPNSHFCGDFEDKFDWSALPLTYLKRIGAADG